MEFHRYVESPNHKIQKAWLSDEAYGQALTAFVFFSDDAIIYDRSTKTVWLAKRKHRPAADMWFFIGGKRNPGETSLECVVRGFNRETKLNITPERFKEPLMLNEYVWQFREQIPIDAGSHSVSFTYGIELTKEEREFAGAHLDPAEYYANHGLRPFTLEELQNTPDVHPSILPLFKKIFAGELCALG